MRKWYTVPRRQVWRFVLLAGSLSLCRTDITSAADRPNVLFISIDDLNDYVGCLGGYPGRSPTPHIDRLSKRGILFTNAHCTSPLCNPSRTSVMTGLRPSTTGVYSNAPMWREAAPEAVVIPDYFRRHGYRVVGGGKIFHTGRRHHPHDVWDHFMDQVMDPKPRHYPLHGIDALRTNFDWGPWDKSNLEMGDGQVVKWAVEFLNQRQDRPFFLAVGIFRPHLPFYAPHEHFRQRPLSKVHVPIRPRHDLDDIPLTGLEIRRWKVHYYETVDRLGRLDEVVQGYLASCAYADALVGRLIEALDRSAYATNTIVVLWSDHGWHLGEKHKVNKHTLWEEATRVPLLVIAPGITRPGGRCAEAVSLLDLYPTLIDLCALPTRKDLEGESLRPLLHDPQTSRERPAVITFGYGNHAVRDERWKYIRYRGGGEELYDHRHDPNEWTNLADAAGIGEIKRRLAAWIPKHDARPVAPNAYPNVPPPR